MYEFIYSLSMITYVFDRYLIIRNLRSIISDYACVIYMLHICVYVIYVTYTSISHICYICIYLASICTENSIWLNHWNLESCCHNTSFNWGSEIYLISASLLQQFVMKKYVFSLSFSYISCCSSEYSLNLHSYCIIRYCFQAMLHVGQP